MPGRGKFGKPTLRDAVSGFVTGLFSIPEGMAYATLGGFSAPLGLWSGIVPTIIGSMFARTVLMVTTLTSGIALTGASVLSNAGLKPNDVGAIATLTVMAGVVMLLLGLFRLGGVMAFVSTAVMTGFTTGIAVQIVAGVVDDTTGFSPTSHDTVGKIIEAFAHVGSWNAATVAVAASTIAVWAVFRFVKPLAALATLIALIGVTVVVTVLGVHVALVSDIADIPRSLPPVTLPEVTALPELALGAVAIAMVALAQAAGISTSVPNPDGSRSDPDRDFIAQGAANAVGGLFGALPTGGSMSRTGVSTSAGARTRWAGIFAGVWLALIVLIAGPLAGYIPMAVIGGLLMVIGGELVAGRVRDIRLVARTSWLSLVAMIATFAATTILPLQQSIFLGAGISIVLTAVQIQRRERVIELTRSDTGGWVVHAPPAKLPSGKTTVLHNTGIGFFAEVPRFEQGLPDIGEAHDAAIVLSVIGMDAVPSATVLMAVERLVVRLRERGIPLVVCGVSPKLQARLKQTKALEVIGPSNVIAATAEFGVALEQAYTRAEALRTRG